MHAGIRRAKGTAPTVKAPAVTAELRAMVAALPNDLRGVRDRAMLLIGLAAALRRSEPVALDIADVAETAGGLVVTLRRSWTDPEGQGRKIGVPYGSHPATCAARAVQRAAGGAGLDPAPYACHSLRAGLATSASAAGTNERSIMNQTGHKPPPILLRDIGEGSLFTDNAARHRRPVIKSGPTTPLA